MAAKLLALALVLCSVTLSTALRGYCAPGCDPSMVGNGKCDPQCMVGDCGFDAADGGPSDCSDVLPTKRHFAEWIMSKKTGDGPLYYDALYPSGSGSAEGSPGSPTAPLPTGRRLLEHSGDGPGAACGEDSTAVDCVLVDIKENEFRMADDNGDGLTAYEAFGLYYMKLAQRGALKGMEKNVMVAMATLSYHGSDCTSTSGPSCVWAPQDSYLPDNEPITVKSLVEWLTGMDHLFAGGMDELDWPEKADKANMDFFFGVFEDDYDPSTMTLPEAFTRGIAGTADDLFGWFDINDDGYVTKDEAMSVYETVVEDGQKGRFVCDGLEVIDATSGKIDVRAPMGVDSHYACGFLVLPSWYYAKLPGAPSSSTPAEGKQETGPEGMSYRRRLPRVAMASMRSKAGKQHAHELDKSEMLKHAARKLMSHSSGDGSGSGSGSGPEAPYLASIQYEGKHVCSGVLVHETVVLTTASCMKDAGPGAVVFVQGEGDFMAHEVASMHVHPSAMFDKHNDVAVLELKEPCAAQPAKLYDGGDLGISDCKRMMLTYSSWNLEESDAAASGSPGPVRRRLLDHSGSPGSGATSPGVTVSDARLVDHKDCMEQYKMRAGSPFGEENLVTRSEICVTAMDGAVHSDMGMPLVAKVRGVDGYVLLGLGTLDAHADLPAIFTRISSSLQWIYAISPKLSSFPQQYTMGITVEQIGLPHNATLTVYPMGAETGTTMEDGVLDSKCMTPWEGSSASGAMLLILDMPPGGSEGCDEECIQTMGFTAKFGLEECETCTDQCATSVTWDKMGPMFEDKGKGYTGGLGKRMVKRIDREYGVWACMRDWSPAEQIACGARHKELACFWFEEKSRHFEFKGLNDKTRLVTPAQYNHGLSVEDSLLRGRTLATSPDQAHV